jgi:hypothetical protein
MIVANEPLELRLGVLTHALADGAVGGDGVQGAGLDDAVDGGEENLRGRLAHRHPPQHLRVGDAADRIHGDRRIAAVARDLAERPIVRHPGERRAAHGGMNRAHGHGHEVARRDELRRGGLACFDGPV